MRPDTHLSRRQLLRWARGGVLAAAGLSAFVPACEWDGNFTILGYTTAPNYDPKYKTIRVPVFGNKTYRRGLEFDLTKAVITQIEEITRMKVVTGQADTELIGSIITTNKNLLNLNQFGEVREGEATITIELVWRDLHTGEILTRPGKRPLDPPPFEPLVPPVAVPGQRDVPIVSPPTAPLVVGQAILASPPESSDPAFRQQSSSGLQQSTSSPLLATPLPPPGVPAPPVPLKITTAATFIPELGPSTTSAYQQAINKLAVQIVSAMESPWPDKCK